jgi:hypothetical protein
MAIHEQSNLPRGALPVLWIITNMVTMIVAFNVVFAWLWQPYLNPIQYAVNLLLIIPLAGGLIFAGTQWAVLKVLRAGLNLRRWFLLTLFAIFLMPLVENLITSGMVVDPFTGLFGPDGFSGISRIAVAFLFTESLGFSVLLSAFSGLFTGIGNGLVLGGFQALALGQRRNGLRWLVGTTAAFALATTINSSIYAYWIFTYQTESFPYLPLSTALLGLSYGIVTWVMLRRLVRVSVMQV